MAADPSERPRPGLPRQVVHRPSQGGRGFLHHGGMKELAAVADEHGVLSHEDARRAGVEPRHLARLASRGELILLARGWYAVGPAGSAASTHALLTRAMLRSHFGRAVASHDSALRLLGLPTYRPDWSRARLNRTTPASSRTRDGLLLGRVVSPDLVAPPPPGLSTPLTVTPALAVVQVGLSAQPMASLIAADAGLRRSLITAGDLGDVVAALSTHPGIGPVRTSLGLVDGRRESPGKTRPVHAFPLMGFPATPQFHVDVPRFLAFIDVVIDGTWVAVEFDGRIKYSRELDSVDAHGRKLSPEERLWLEKRREDRLGEIGFEVLRVVWSELDDLEALGRRIRVAIERSRRRHGASVPTRGLTRPGDRVKWRVSGP